MGWDDETGPGETLSRIEDVAGSPEIVGRLPKIHIGSSSGWAGGRLRFELCLVSTVSGQASSRP